MMKIICVLTALALLISCVAFAASEGEIWVCPSCGTECTFNFCPKCGNSRPENPEKPETRKEDELIRLDLAVQFEKNSYFSTYDVRLFIDDEWITTLRHGVDYNETLYVAPGKHFILFRKDGGNYLPEASAFVNVESPSLYGCRIHTSFQKIIISDETLELIDDQKPEMGNREDTKYIDGNTRLKVYIEFKKNALFSVYDVDMYLDDIFIATLPHGKDYNGTWMVSEGKHLLVFYEAGGKTKKGTYTLTVEGDTAFSCRIEATRNGVEVKKRNVPH